MKEKINILFLVSKFDIGGVQSVNVRMLNSIDKDKFEVHVLYIKDGVMKEDIIDSDIKFTKIGDKLKLKSLINIIYLFKIINYIKKNNIQIVHTIDPILYILGATASYYTKTKHIRSQPNFIRKYEKLNTKTIKILPFEKWTDKYIAFNNATKKDLHLAGVANEKIYTIYSYPKVSKPKKESFNINIRKELDISSETKIVCSIGRLVRKKGLETFINMIPDVLKEYQNVIFLVVGDGYLKEELIKTCQRQGIEDSVYFLGYRRDISNIVSEINLGVYATSESAGMIDIVRGNKVLVSRQSDIMGEYIINGGTGILVDSDDPKDYARIVISLLKRPKDVSLMELNTKEFYSENFNGDKNIKKFEELASVLVNG